MRSRTIQTAAAVAGVAALLSLPFVIHLPSDKAWLRVCLDGSHGPIFAAVAVIIAVWLRARADERGVGVAWPAWAISIQALLATVAIGIVVEGSSRACRIGPPSAFDVMTDTAGPQRALHCGCCGRDRDRAAVRPATGICVGRWSRCVWQRITFVAWRPMQAAAAYAQRMAEFPVLAQFERERDLYFVTPDGTATGLAELPAPWSQRPGERALRLAFDAAHPPAVQHRRAEPGLARLLRGGGRPHQSRRHGDPARVRILDATHDWSHADRFNLPSCSATDADHRARGPGRGRVGPGRPPHGHGTHRQRDAVRPDNPAGGELYVSRLWLE